MSKKQSKWYKKLLYNKTHGWFISIVICSLLSFFLIVIGGAVLDHTSIKESIPYATFMSGFMFISFVIYKSVEGYFRYIHLCDALSELQDELKIKEAYEAKYGEYNKRYNEDIIKESLNFGPTTFTYDDSVDPQLLGFPTIIKESINQGYIHREEKGEDVREKMKNFNLP